MWLMCFNRPSSSCWCVWACGVGLPVCSPVHSPPSPDPRGFVQMDVGSRCLAGLPLYANSIPLSLNSDQFLVPLHPGILHSNQTCSGQSPWSRIRFSTRIYESYPQARLRWGRVDGGGRDDLERQAQEPVLPGPAEERWSALLSPRPRQFNYESPPAAMSAVSAAQCVR